MDELDDYICPSCGGSSETCHCLEYYNNGAFGNTSDNYDDYEYEDDELEYESDYEVVCLLDGKPLYVEDIDKLL